MACSEAEDEAIAEANALEAEALMVPVCSESVFSSSTAFSL